MYVLSGREVAAIVMVSVPVCFVPLGDLCHDLADLRSSTGLRLDEEPELKVDAADLQFLPVDKVPVKEGEQKGI